MKSRSWMIFCTVLTIIVGPSLVLSQEAITPTPSSPPRSATAPQKLNPQPSRRFPTPAPNGLFPATQVREDQKVVPAKFISPTGKPTNAEQDEDQLRKRFTAIAEKRAAIMSADELKTEISTAEKEINEFEAAQALKDVEKALESVAKKYPATAAGQKAEKALKLLQDDRGTTFLR